MKESSKSLLFSLFLVDLITMLLRDTAKRLAFISIVFIILFNFPFISVFNTFQSFLGVPVLYLYMFVAWVLFIIVLIIFMRRNINSNRK